MKPPARIAVIVFIAFIFFVVGLLVSNRHHAHDRRESARLGGAVAPLSNDMWRDADGPFDLPMDEERRGEGSVDVYGNDVTSAVAQYQLDSSGTLFETHSPRTELLKLKPPTS